MVFHVHLTLIFVFISVDVGFSQLVTIPNYGTLKGKEIKTMGNLDNPSKTYYTFRNIPYAQSVSGEKRFSVRLKLI